MKLITPIKRHGMWYLRCRVPERYTAFDPRNIIRVSTHIRVADDPLAIRAAPIATQLYRDLEEEWRAKASGQTPNARQRYDDAVLNARGLGLTYLPTPELLTKSVEEVVRRVEKLIERRYGDAPAAVSAALGGEDRPVIMVSQLFTEYEALQTAALAQMSPDQVRKWGNQRKRAVENLKDALGDGAIPLVELTKAHGKKFRQYWQDRIVDEELDIGTANKSIGNISKMLRVVSNANGLEVPAILSGLRIEGGITGKRPPFEISFIQERILAPGAMDELNEEARRVVYVMVESGLRPSEIVNLTESTIHLGHNVPHVEIIPEGRVLKTRESWRKMPLVGVALEAMRLQPKGFPRYFDAGSSLSALVNQYFENHGLKPTEKHTLYSLRHSFEDRLDSLKVMPDKIQAYLMGHKYSRPKYGGEPPLENLQEWLNKIAFPRFPAAL
jgi:integrase